MVLVSSVIAMLEVGLDQVGALEPFEVKTWPVEPLVIKEVTPGAVW